MFMCQWMPATMPLDTLPPPVLISMRISRGVFFSSSPQSFNPLSCAPQNFSGQWHCSHVSCAGRRFSTGVGTGFGYLFAMVAYTWYAPDSFDLTYHVAPAPMWQFTHPTRACGESL